MIDGPILTIATAGSVDDGKSTLIGRLLWETDSLPTDQVVAIEEASRQRGLKTIDLSLVMDGLRAEREQGITIDVAYRPFHSQSRRYLLADSPGHEEYTRNMVTAASNANAIIILADAARGLTTQTRRHLSVASLLGIPHVILAVNKMDLVGYDQAIFDGILNSLKSFAKDLTGIDLTAIPISALVGDNVVTHSEAMPWYQGPSLLGHLDSLQNPVNPEAQACLPVQFVMVHEGRRYYAGTLRGGSLKPGDTILTPSGSQAAIAEVLIDGNPTPEAKPNTPITARLDREVDIARGDWLTSTQNPPKKSDTLRATLFWLQSDILRVGMTYTLRQGPRTLPAKVASLDGVLDFQTAAFAPSSSLAMNEIGKATLSLARSVPLLPYTADRDLGSFILCDSHNQTVAAGLVEEILALQKQAQTSSGLVVWLTGLSGAGKSTLADATAPRLEKAIHLDADQLRNGLNSNLGFSAEDRMENVRRTAEVAKLFARQGYVVFCSIISPLNAHRDLCREIIGDAFFEVYVNCKLQECERRDVKGLYARARSGAIKEFTGISAPYEVPENPALTLFTDSSSLEECVETLIRAISLRVS